MCVFLDAVWAGVFSSNQECNAGCGFMSCAVIHKESFGAEAAEVGYLAGDADDRFQLAMDNSFCTSGFLAMFSGVDS
jgi:hypothetical protein